MLINWLTGTDIGGVTEVMREEGKGKREECQVRADAAGIGPYLAATRELAASKGVPLLDLNAAAKEAFLKMTKKEIEAYYMVLGPGESWYALKGKSDRCHPRDKGADFYPKAPAPATRPSSVTGTPASRTAATTCPSVSALSLPLQTRKEREIGRASCRERV